MKAISAFRKSSSFTLSIIFTVMLMFAVVFVTYFLLLANDDLLIKESEAAIDADSAGFYSIYNISGAQGVKDEIKIRIQSPNNDFYYHYKNGQQEAVVGNITEWPDPNSEVLKNGLLRLNLNASKTQSAMAKIITFDNADQLMIARNIEELEQAQWVGKTFGWVMIILLCTISIISVGVAYYVVNRINKISDKTDEIISTGNLSARLSIDSSWDDLSKLSVSLNYMLNNFEQSIANIKSVTDSIAHDLRTPLARLRTQIEVIDDEQAKAILTAETDNILGIFNSLLRISEIEHERKKNDFTEHDIKSIIQDVCELYLPAIEAKGILLTTHLTLESTALTCDKHLIFQAFSNIIDNAIKFTPPRGQITISAMNTSNVLRFEVYDSGKGVAHGDIDKLTQRFYRADKSRTTKGNGLGLALVLAVIELHQGELKFIQDPLGIGSGLGCIITLPVRI